MRLTHFALSLTLILLAITSYLAWEGQQEIKGLKREREFDKEQLRAEKTASPDQGSLVPLPSTPAASITPPPAPGTIAAAPTPPAELMAGTSTLPGGGLTVPKTVIEAEAKGISTNTLTSLQKQVIASPAVARVKTVVKDQGFVVLDAGTKQSLAKGQKYEIRRGNSILARITLTDAIEASEAVADLDFASIPAGVEIEPGDEIIAPVAR
ncbi:MAG: hypothetical protein V4672_20365 [Verrucomicrobiota bacterium]